MNEPGDVLLYDTQILVYYRRIVVPTDGEVEWTDCAFDPAADLRQRRANRLVSGVQSLTQAQSEQLFTPRTVVRWRDAASTAAEMQKSLDEQAASLRNLFQELQRRKLVEVSGMRFRIETTVDDLRSGASVRLPALAPREIIVP